MKDYVPNAMHVFIGRNSTQPFRRLLVMGNPTPVAVSTLLKEVALAWEHELRGDVPLALGPDAFRECLLIASQAVDHALDVETMTAMLHDAKNLIRNRCATIENAKIRDRRPAKHASRRASISRPRPRRHRRPVR